MPDSDLPAPDPSAYVVAHCEGRRCVEVLDFADLTEEAPTEAEAVAALERLALLFRDGGAVGRLVLRERRTGAVVAERRVWP